MVLSRSLQLWAWTFEPASYVPLSQICCYPAVDVSASQTHVGSTPGCQRMRRVDDGLHVPAVKNAAVQASPVVAESRPLQHRSLGRSRCVSDTPSWLRKGSGLQRSVDSHCSCRS